MENSRSDAQPSLVKNSTWNSLIYENIPTDSLSSSFLCLIPVPFPHELYQNECVLWLGAIGEGCFRLGVSRDARTKLHLKLYISDPSAKLMRYFYSTFLALFSFFPCLSRFITIPSTHISGFFRRCKFNKST